MRHSLHRAGALLGAVVLVAGLGAAAGCGDDKTGDTRTGVTKGSDKVSADTDTDTGDVTVDTQAGTFTAGKDLPEGFPTDDVPLVDEQVLSGVKGGADSSIAWSVVLTTSRAVDDVTAEVKKAFADAGYQAGQGSNLGDVSVLSFKGDTYDVGVTAARTDGGVTVTYVVKNAG